MTLLEIGGIIDPTQGFGDHVFALILEVIFGSLLLRSFFVAVWVRDSRMLVHRWFNRTEIDRDRIETFVIDDVWVVNVGIFAVLDDGTRTYLGLGARSGSYGYLNPPLARLNDWLAAGGRRSGAGDS